jgi:23S rRNA pseudouridine2604 synthase
MSFRNRLQYLLVQTLKISNKEALSFLMAEKVLVNGKVCKANPTIMPEDQVICNHKMVQQACLFRHFAFYKPRGIETTLNTAIADNLADILPFDFPVFPVGRLDKESEGLLLLTNDGRLYDKTLRKEHKVVKKYKVKVNKPIDNHFLSHMAAGIEIMGKRTLPCTVNFINDFEFEILLTQGLNRQIRRMCYKLGYEVLKLVRHAIGSLELGHLRPGEWREIGNKMNE